MIYAARAGPSRCVSSRSITSEITAKERWQGPHARETRDFVSAVASTRVRTTNHNEALITGDHRQQREIKPSAKRHDSNLISGHGHGRASRTGFLFSRFNFGNVVAASLFSAVIYARVKTRASGQRKLRRAPTCALFHTAHTAGREGGRDTYVRFRRTRADGTF